MSHWETTSTLATDVATSAIWERAYANADAWSEWNAELKRALEPRKKVAPKAKANPHRPATSLPRRRVRGGAPVHG